MILFAGCEDDNEVGLPFQENWCQRRTIVMFLCRVVHPPKEDSEMTQRKILLGTQRMR